MMTNILLYTILFFQVVLIVWVITHELRIRRFTRGGNGKSLEGHIGEILEKIQKITSDHTALQKKHIELDNRLKKSIRNIETIRFNPFPDQGGNQSFATALLNDEKNGVIISTLFSRERTSVFAKPIINGKSDYELTVEEKTVLEKTLI